MLIIFFKWRNTPSFPTKKETNSSKELSKTESQSAGSPNNWEWNFHPPNRSSEHSKSQAKFSTKKDIFPENSTTKRLKYPKPTTKATFHPSLRKKKGKKLLRKNHHKKENKKKIKWNRHFNRSKAHLESVQTWRNTPVNITPRCTWNRKLITTSTYLHYAKIKHFSIVKIDFFSSLMLFKYKGFFI